MAATPTRRLASASAVPALLYRTPQKTRQCAERPGARESRPRPVA
jgi:hypothetical protein